MKGLLRRFTGRRPVEEPSIHRDGARVSIRPLRLTDDMAVYAYASDPAVTRFLPWHPAPTLGTVRNFLVQQLGRRRRGESYAFAVERRDTGMMIGSTDLMGLHEAPTGQAELGYILGREHWGQGLMTEAAALTVAAGFEDLGLDRIVAFADIDNTGSCRVLEKIGLRRIGTENRMVKDEDRTYARYQLARSEWDGSGGNA
ncbi:MAG: GNAT family N-acetyltransferase [Armatimonadota bacterium]